MEQSSVPRRWTDEVNGDITEHTLKNKKQTNKHTNKVYGIYIYFTSQNQVTHKDM